MNDEYYNEYMKVENKTLMGQGLGRFDSDPFAFLSGLRQAANILPNNPKVDWAVNKIVETARIGRTSLIFSNFKEAGVFLVADRLGEEYPNIKYEMITGDISTKKRDNIVEKYNNGEISALFITEAGSEGLDLKKTKSVILLERSWNIAAEKQVMGRAVRYKSHDGEEDKLVNVYRLMVVKPPGNTDKYPSADKMLETIIEQKVETIQNFISRIVSIEDCLD